MRASRSNAPDKGRRSRFSLRILTSSALVRHALGSALLLAFLVPMGAAALMHGHKVSVGITLRGQENFSSFRTASSEAGR